MEIIIASLYFRKDRITGANKRFEEICKALLRSQRSFTIIVNNNQTPEWSNNNKNIKTIELKSAKTGNKLLNRAIAWIKLGVILKQQPASIFINDFLPIPMNVNKHRHYQLIHDIRSFTEYSRYYSRLASWFQKSQWSKCENIICVSNFTKNEIINKCNIPKNKITISYNGISNEYLSEYKQQPRPIDILYIATFEKRKNHINLINAIKIIKKHNKPRIKCIFLGKDLGLRNSIVTEIEKYNLEGNIKIIDNINEDNLIKLYKETKVFMSPSLYEGFGMPLIEALASYCYIGCSDIEVFHEICGPYAEYFDPNSPQDIADTIKTLLNSYYEKNDIREENIKRYIDENYKWDKVTNTLISNIIK